MKSTVLMNFCLLQITIISSLFAEVDHYPKWISFNELSYGLNYSLPELRDGNDQPIIPHKLGNYGYSRWGNLMSTDFWGDYKITRLTRKPFEYDLFLSRYDDRVSYLPFPIGTSWPTVSWPPLDKYAMASIPAYDGFSQGYLFRYLHFLNDALKKVPTNLIYTLNPYSSSGSGFDYQQLPGHAKKLVILVHGWNPESHYSGFYNPEEPYGGNFAILTRALQNALKGTDWHLIHYNWADDSDTGSDMLSTAVNGTEAAETGTQHGWHLAKLIENDNPETHKVHLIAHSAGTWVAWAAAFYLTQYMPDVTVQITLLDPFMPSSVPFVTSVLGTTTFEQFIQTNGFYYNRLFQAENYWADDIAIGTNTPNFNFRFDFAGFEDVNLRTETGIYNEGYPSHSGPILFYADTVINSYQNNSGNYFGKLGEVSGFDPELHGWERSMAYIEKNTGNAGFSEAIVFRTGLGVDRTYGIMNIEGAGRINHDEHGIQYPYGDFETGMYLYDGNLKCFLYTNATVYPYFYFYKKGYTGWHYYLRGTTVGQRIFFNSKLGSWKSESQF